MPARRARAEPGSLSKNVTHIRTLAQMLPASLAGDYMVSLYLYYLMYLDYMTSLLFSKLNTHSVIHADGRGPVVYQDDW